MTRRVFETEDGWYVATGWDRMLQHFFIDISRTCDCDGEPDECSKCHGYGDEFAYNNLDDPKLIATHGGLSFDQVREVLDTKLTYYPAPLLGQLWYDHATDAGNDVTDYGTVGRLKAGV